MSADQVAVPEALAPDHRVAQSRLVLGVVLLATLAINVETTVVNVALPTLASALDTGTSGLQWIVDAYTLPFAALVLAGGTIGDRFGRRLTLICGLVLFAAGSVGAGLSSSLAELLTFRAVMGAASALIYPTTLAIITATFRDPPRRAAAIGVWGATAGLGVAVGPVLGGALLRVSSWGSVFLALAPAALAAAVGTWLLVPRTAAPVRRRLDVPGLLLSVVTLGALVHTLIEAPDRGWLTGSTVAGFVVAAVAFVAFALVERRSAAPLIDGSLFRDLRFSAASGAIAVAFFGLFGFIFLITQYFQLLQDLDAFTTGVRTLPVAASIAVGSVGGTRLAQTRLGTKTVATLGLLLLAVAFWWVSNATADTSYSQIAGQMVLLGAGLGLTTAPATDAIMGVVRPEQAGAGSAVNDATRQIGGTLGVAVVGSIAASLYTTSLDTSAAVARLPRAVQDTVRQGLAEGLAVARQLPAPLSGPVHDAVGTAFLAGLHDGCLTTAVVCAAGAVVTALLLPRRPRPVAADERATPATAPTEVVQ